jgi:predicted P-loop ATPase
MPGEPWHLTSAEEALMREEHEDRMEDDPWEERVATWVARQGKRPFSIDDVLDGRAGYFKDPAEIHGAHATRR